jgi:NhaP-type Na+/H+ or K+/H+ antiporter
MRHIKLIQLFHPINFSKDVHKFKEITTELAFLTRALFFILFGFLIELKEVLNSKTIILAASITIGIFVVRYIVLKLSKVPTDPMVFIAPRGLITILLFLSIPISRQIIPIDKSLITQIIILSSLFMMIGLLRYKKPKTTLKQESPVSNK